MKIRIFGKNLGLYDNFDFFKLRFALKHISIFDQNIDFYPKFRCLMKILITRLITTGYSYYFPTILSNISFWFLEKFDFFSKFSIIWKVSFLFCNISIFPKKFNFFVKMWAIFNSDLNRHSPVSMDAIRSLIESRFRFSADDSRFNKLAFWVDKTDSKVSLKISFAVCSRSSSCFFRLCSCFILASRKPARL